MFIARYAVGSTVAKADSTGRILWQENRLPYGKNTKLNDKQIEENPLQYTNAPLDTHSGLTYLKARYYNAEIGRFYAVDQKWYDSEDPQSFGRYTYVSNNPYKYTDPTGLDKWSVVSKQQNYTTPIMSDAVGEAIANVAGMALTPIGFVQDYQESGIGWAIAGIIPGVSEIRKANKATKTLFHYTDDAGLQGILKSKKLNPSLKANNPKDAYYGDGQYLSDVAPGTRTNASLSRTFINNPWQGKKFKNYVEIDVTGLDVKKGREGVFVIKNDKSLDLKDRIVDTGRNEKFTDD